MSLPSTAQLLTSGGDDRIRCQLETARNHYGCSPVPEPKVLAYGSSTASTISTEGFAAADALRQRLEEAGRREPSSITYARELDRLRATLTHLCGLEGLPGLEIIFGASGTDLHLFASQFMEASSLIIGVEEGETGRRVPAALSGHHFSEQTAMDQRVQVNLPLGDSLPAETVWMKCREEDGTPRPAASIQAEVEAQTAQAVANGKRVLLVLTDVSKTGLLPFTPACARALRDRFPKSAEVLVDACQFRLAPQTLRAYLENDFSVAITGSKFVTGPAFCGALLIPGKAAQRLRTRPLSFALKAYTAKADWPKDWAARNSLDEGANYGLLLRWEAALAELRAFRSLSDEAVATFLEKFGQTVRQHMAHHPAFEPLSIPAYERDPIVPGKTWDRFPTLFPFLLRRDGRFLTREETAEIYQRLREEGVQLGQPAACGIRDGVPVSALRLCLGTRQIVDALAPEGRGEKAVVAEALAVLARF